MSTTIYAEHQNVLASLVQWDAIFRGEGSVQFARDVTLHAPDAGIGQRDRVVILRVVAAGPGNVSRGKLNPCTLDTDDLVIANLFHETQQVRIMGDNFSMFNWEQIMGKLKIDHETHSIDLQPLQAYLVCKPDEAAAQKLMMGKSRIISPHGDAQFSGGSEPEFDPRRKAPERTKTVIERCVQVGPGAVVDGMWQEPPAALQGAMVLYDTSVAPVRFVVGGQTHTLVHWRHVLLSFRDEHAAEASTAA
jgi:hypothetical protein